MVLPKIPYIHLSFSPHHLPFPPWKNISRLDCQTQPFLSQPPKWPGTGPNKTTRNCVKPVLLHDLSFPAPKIKTTGPNKKQKTENVEQKRRLFQSVLLRDLFFFHRQRSGPLDPKKTSKKNKTSCSIEAVVLARVTALYCELGHKWWGSEWHNGLFNYSRPMIGRAVKLQDNEQWGLIAHVKLCLFFFSFSNTNSCLGFISQVFFICIL